MKIYLLFLESLIIFIWLKKKNRQRFQKLNQDKFVLTELVTLLDQYPNLENEYLNNNYRVIIEESINNSFLKRIAFFSDSLSLSIYFNNCSFERMYDSFFNHWDPIEYYRE